MAHPLSGIRYNGGAGTKEPAGTMNNKARQMLEEYWTNQGGEVGQQFPTREEVVGHCLVRWAENIALSPCPQWDTCEGCNLDFSIWWDWMNSLSRNTRIAVQNVMLKCDIPLPPGPWEEVPTNAVSASRN